MNALGPRPVIATLLLLAGSLAAAGAHAQAFDVDGRLGMTNADLSLPARAYDRGTPWVFGADLFQRSDALGDALDGRDRFDDRSGPLLGFDEGSDETASGAPAGDGPQLGPAASHEFFDRAGSRARDDALFQDIGPQYELAPHLTLGGELEREAPFQLDERRPPDRYTFGLRISY